MHSQLSVKGAEDGACIGNTGSVYNPKGIRITTLPANGMLLYNNVPVSAGQLISDPAASRVQFTGIGYTSVTFEYAYIDGSNLEADPAAYELNWGAPLPIEIGGFTATAKGNHSVLLTWTTLVEINNTGFEIQRGTDGRSWERIAFVKSKTEAGKSDDKLTYDFIDAAPVNGDNYYRIMQVDLDGEATYSAIRLVRISGDQIITIFPNPATDRIHVSVADQSVVGGIRLMDVNGRVLFVQSSYVDGIDLSSYATGTYYVRVVTKDGEVLNFMVSKL